MRSGVFCTFVLVWSSTVMADAPRPWQATLDAVEAQRDDLSAALLQALDVLVPRASTEQPGLLPSLTLDRPAPRPTGYGILPAIEPDNPHRPVPVRREKRYSLAALGDRLSGDVRSAQALLTGLTALPLQAAADEFLRLRGRLRNHESHIGYHRQWQAAIEDTRAWFNGRNAVIRQVRALDALEAAGAGAAQTSALAADIQRGIRTFVAHPTLRVTCRAGLPVLPVTVTTDITDQAFIEQFAAAVRASFGAGVSLDIDILDPKVLYPGGAPASGAPIDVAEHLTRFPDGTLVLTTGARSTFAQQAKHVVLGPEPLSSRELAHEFGHLLGFSDVYLRGYEGDGDDPNGFIIVEWTGLATDLMGWPSGGEVTGEMITTLSERYATATCGR